MVAQARQYLSAMLGCDCSAVPDDELPQMIVWAHTQTAHGTRQYRAAWRMARVTRQSVTGRAMGWVNVEYVARRYAMRHGAPSGDWHVLITDGRTSYARHARTRAPYDAHALGHIVARGSGAYCKAYSRALARYGVSSLVGLE